jgi:hypothetical protein
LHQVATAPCSVTDLRNDKLKLIGHQTDVLSTGSIFVILRFAVGQNLHTEHREGKHEENMNVTTFMQEKL